MRHRQTKGAATDMFSLQPLRHTSTLPGCPHGGDMATGRYRRSGVNDEADRERPLPTPSEPFRSLTERSTALAQSHQFEHVLGMSARPQRTALLDADPLENAENRLKFINCRPGVRVFTRSGPIAAVRVAVSSSKFQDVPHCQLRPPPTDDLGRPSGRAGWPDPNRDARERLCPLQTR